MRPTIFRRAWHRALMEVYIYEKQLQDDQQRNSDRAIPEKKTTTERTQQNQQPNTQIRIYD